jgi:hypothetical protein
LIENKERQLNQSKLIGSGSRAKKDKMDFEIILKRYSLIQKPNRGCYECFAVSVVVALAVRLACVVHGVLLVATVINRYNTIILNYLYPILILILVDGFYVAFCRHGRESKYFSLSMFLYILACTPPIWILHAKRHEYILHLLLSKKSGDSDDVPLIFLADKPGFTAQDEHDYRKHEHIFMAMLVLSTWFLPKDDLTRDDTYSLMIQNISMAADAHEMFFSSDDLKILTKKNDVFPIVILGAWTLSLPLFVINTSTETYTNKRFRYVTKRHFEKLFGNFYWKYLISMILMDGPFFIIRIVGVIGYQVIGLQNIFYIAKNVSQIVIQVSRILGKIYFPEDVDLKEQMMRIQDVQRTPLNVQRRSNNAQQ